MVNRYVITREQALYAIENGEFGSDMLLSAGTVIAIMSQDWCPQWHDMRSWIYNLQTDEDIDIYELIYNKVDYFDEFRQFKENVWKNHEIPYLRYYKNGKLLSETNYVNEQRLKSIIIG